MSFHYLTKCDRCGHLTELQPVRPNGIDGMKTPPGWFSLDKHPPDHVCVECRGPNPPAPLPKEKKPRMCMYHSDCDEADLDGRKYDLAVPHLGTWNDMKKLLSLRVHRSCDLHTDCKYSDDLEEILAANMQNPGLMEMKHPNGITRFSVTHKKENERDDET